MQALMNYHFPELRSFENSVGMAVALPGPVIRRGRPPKYILEDKKLGEEARTIRLSALRSRQAISSSEALSWPALINESGGNSFEPHAFLHNPPPEPSAEGPPSRHRPGVHSFREVAPHPAVSGLTRGSSIITGHFSRTRSILAHHPAVEKPAPKSHHMIFSR